MNKVILQSIRDFMVEVEELQILANKRLLELDTGYGFENKFHDFFIKNLSELDKESQLEFKRDFATKQTHWKKVTYSIYNFFSVEDSLKIVTPRKIFIESVLNRNNLNLPNTGFVPGNRSYSGHELLRDIISSAKNEVILVDSHFHPNILRLIGEIIDEDNKIKFKILTHIKKNTRLSALKTALQLFSIQYPGIISEAKMGKISHARYIIIDSSKLFHFDSSFHDLGSRDSSYTNKKDELEIKQTLDSVFKHFQESIDII